MAEVRPFKGTLYNGSKVGDYEKVMAPPYDVIPPAMQDELYQKSDFNIIRLILGKSCDGDNETDNKYIRSRKALESWIQEDILAQDDKEAFYAYLQEYEHKGQICRRLGFLGLLKIENPEDKKVLPHEYTLSKPKEDRMNLIKEVRGNLSPIFTIFSDNGGDVTSILTEKTSAEQPVIDIEISGVRHKLWRICDSEAVEKIASLMEDKKVFIADGHHRYEVARAYRDMRRQEEGYDGRADHIMMYFTDMAGGSDLTVMATHRAIKEMPVADDEKIISKLGEHFEIAECGDLPELMGHIEGVVGADQSFGYFGGEKYLLMKLKNRESVLELFTEEKSKDWKLLDVSVLHSIIFKNLLSMENSEGNITYVRDPEDAEALVRGGSHKAAFFLNSTRVDQLKAVAEHGDMMPQKSTYFYPKLLTGLVINRFDK